MKKITTNQETLLLSKSSFFQRDWCERDKNNHAKRLSQKEQLIELCWNGMLNEMIPEIFEPSANKKPLTLWEINETENFLDLRYGDFDKQINDEWSINPYVIMEFAGLN